MIFWGNRGTVGVGSSLYCLLVTVRVPCPSYAVLCLKNLRNNAIINYIFTTLQPVCLYSSLLYCNRSC